MHSRNLRKEEDFKASYDINYGEATVCYKGNDIWVGLKGKMLIGQVIAHEYAKRLNQLIERMK